MKPTSPRPVELTTPDGGAREDATQLDSLTDELLRRMIHASRSRPGLDQNAGALLRGVCDEARLRDLRVEEMVIVIKARWRRLPEARQATRDGVDSVLPQLISLCIREYYARERS
jgi:hypothetical protein